MSNAIIKNLRGAIEIAKQVYGEPEYRYFKKNIAIRRRGRGGVEHVRPISDGVTVTKGEYDANIEESRRLSREAFMSRLRTGYWEYGREMTKSGWREELQAVLKNWPESSNTLPLSRER